MCYRNSSCESRRKMDFYGFLTQVAKIFLLVSCLGVTGSFGLNPAKMNASYPAVCVA